MSLSGIDTSQLISQFTTNESQQEWADVEKALLEAFPEHSVEELHATASALLIQMPDLDIESLVEIMAERLNVEVSTKLATEIRTEWDEFNKASGLDPKELVAVLDDYAGDSVDTNSQRYLMLLMNALRHELQEVAGDADEAAMEAEKERLDAEFEEFMESLEHTDDRSAGEKAKDWGIAALTIAGAVLSVGLAVATLGLAAPSAVSMCMFAASATAHAATGEDYSLATVCSDILQSMGFSEGVADVLGTIFEVGHVLQAMMFMGTAGLVGEAGRIVDLFGSAEADLVDEESNETGETDGTGGEYSDYEMTEAEVGSLKAALAQMVAMLKSGERLDAAMLDAIINALKGGLSEQGGNYLDSMLDDPGMVMA